MQRATIRDRDAWEVSHPVLRDRGDFQAVYRNNLLELIDSVEYDCFIAEIRREMVEIAHEPKTKK